MTGAVLVAAPFVLAQTRPAPAKSAPAKSQAPAKTPPKEAAPQPTTYPLESLRIEGNKLIPSARIIAASGLTIGSKVQKGDFDKARDRLIATGAFENAGYEFKPSAAET